MIIPVYKNLGKSTHQLAQQIGEKYQEKATHTGTLDPMAEGVVIVLTGKDRYKKDYFKNWKKSYDFEVLLGVSTDSHDLLGKQIDLVNNQGSIFSTKTQQHLSLLLSKLVGTKNQVIPKFSAKRIQGKSNFNLAKDGKDIKQQTQAVHIYELRLVDKIKEISLNELQSRIDKKISLVEGDFRQPEIHANWTKTINKLGDRGITKLPIIRIHARTSRRTYIRGIVRDISMELGIPATTYSIVRTKNGPYSVKHCIKP